MEISSLLISITSVSASDSEEDKEEEEEEAKISSNEDSSSEYKLGLGDAFKLLKDFRFVRIWGATRRKKH